MNAFIENVGREQIKAMKKQNLEMLSLRARATAFFVAHKCGEGHLSSSLSMIEILVSILKYSEEFPSKHVLSKGHAALGLYSVYSEFGLIDKRMLLDYGKPQSTFTSHPVRKTVDAIELSSGSLGMGLGFGAGISLANKMESKSEKVFVILGDGECNEGSVWESAMIASTLGLTNLVAIVDNNKIQAVAQSADYSKDTSLGQKFSAFGWEVFDIDGHDVEALLNTFKIDTTKPKAIIANTTGKKSFTYEFDSVLWNYRKPSDNDLTDFIDAHSLESLTPDLLELFQ